MRLGGELASLLHIPNAQVGDERRRLWRQAVAALADAPGSAPLEGFDPAALLASVCIALTDPTLRDLSWLAPAAAARVQFELAQALPVSNERRELGRQVLASLRGGDRDTFLVLATAMALTSPRALEPPAVRARLEVVLAAPLSAPGGVGGLALAMIARPELARHWLVNGSTGSLPHRRLAGRLLAHAAREVVARGGDGAELFGQAEIAAAHHRLLSDREALVWRYPAIARGLVAHARPEAAAEIEHELQLGGDTIRRAATSAAAALESGGMALRWQPTLIARAKGDPGISRAVVHGLAGVAVTHPAVADALAAEVLPGGIDGCEALADLFREEGSLPLPRARESALAWLSREADGSDDGSATVAADLRDELVGASVGASGPSTPLSQIAVDTRRELDAGHLGAALELARRGIDELSAIADFLERAVDSDAHSRQRAMRAIRDVERGLFADGAIAAALALHDSDSGGLRSLQKHLERLERAILGQESAAETAGALPHYRLRLTRLRALVRLLDGAGGTGVSSLGPRLPALTALLRRARGDQSPLRRAVWAAMTRTWDALVRDDDLHVSDLLLGVTTWFDPQEDLSVIREATMVPMIEAALDAYQRLAVATWEAVDPDDATPLVQAAARLGELGRTLPRSASPRVESLRDAILRMARALDGIARASGRTGIPASAMPELSAAIGAIAEGVVGARRRIGLAVGDRPADAVTALSAVRVAIDRSVAGQGESIDDEVAGLDALGALIPPAIAQLVVGVLTRVARLPVESDNALPLVVPGVGLPTWLPMSKTIGGFCVLSSIGTGGGGSVFVACRSDDRGRPQPATFALKVPDYDGTAAGVMSESEFEAMFRQEAGALLALPAHPNLSGFITFDAGARPKPILVMELVPGPTLERVVDRGGLNMTSAIDILDGLAAGLAAMHACRVAHLDIKPQNVILRPVPGTDRSVPVLVDFGLAGRQLRPGCGSPHYGAPEVWQTTSGSHDHPFPSDVYALACVAFEVMTGQVLIDGTNINSILQQRRDSSGARRVRRSFRSDPSLSAFGEVLVASLSPDPAARPTIERFRAGLQAVAADVRRGQWPAAAAPRQ